MTMNDEEKSNSDSPLLPDPLRVSSGEAVINCHPEGSKRQAVPVYLRSLEVVHDCLRPGWDGKNAERLSNLAIDTAQEFLNKVAHLKTPLVSPGLDGSLALFWEDYLPQAYCFLYVDFKPRDVILYAYQIKSQERSGATSYGYDAATNLYESVKEVLNLMGESRNFFYPDQIWFDSTSFSDNIS